MSTERAVELVVHRWCDRRNARSDEFRHGTWYGVDPAGIMRYRNTDPRMRLGGASLISGTIRAENPCRIDIPAHRVLYDAWNVLPFGDRIHDIAFAKERQEIRRILARMVEDPEDRTRFRGMPSFVLKTMLAERAAAAWSRAAGHDLLIVRVDGMISEIFDHEGLFRPEDQNGIHGSERIGKAA